MPFPYKRYIVSAMILTLACGYGLIFKDQEVVILRL
jgi:hypothetical protein